MKLSWYLGIVAPVGGVGGGGLIEYMKLYKNLTCSAVEFEWYEWIVYQVKVKIKW